MEKARGTPLLIDGSNAMSALERVQLGSGHHSEEWLQAVIHDQPQILPIAQIEPGMGAIMPVAREVPCGHGYIDNLYVTGDGGIVLVEAKLWANPQARREVVAQALDYVAALTGMTYEQFEQAAAKSPSGPATLYGCVSGLPDALNEAEFVDAVSANLARGRMLVLVVGDGIRREAEALADLLQSHAGAHFTFALVELAMWREADTGRLLVVPDVLARTIMIERGVVRVLGSAIEVVAPAQAALNAKPATMTQEMFYEHLDKLGHGLAQHVRDFVDLIEPLGVYPEFKASLNLKADLPESDTTINFGYITKTGKLWTDPCTWSAGLDIARPYNRALADLIDGSVASFPGGNLYLSTNGKSAPLIGALLPHHADAWAAAIGEAITALQSRAAGVQDPGRLAMFPASSVISPDTTGSFEEAYKAGVPMVGIVDGEPRSPVMGFIRLADGFAWCDDGILAAINPGNPLHPVEGMVEEHGTTIRCGHTELRPIDPEDRTVMAYWNDAVAHFGNVEAMHARAEHLLRTFEETSATHRR